MQFGSNHFLEKSHNKEMLNQNSFMNVILEY